MNRKLKISGLFQALIGMEILGIWTLILVQGNIPELTTEPWEIRMHMLAEAVTGVLLLFSGLSILIRGKKHWIFHLSLGALLYTLIASSGYYAQQEKWGMVGMFMFLLLVTCLILINRKK